MGETTAIHQSLIKNLLELHKSRGSSVVRVVRGSEKKQLVVRNGCLAFAESNLQDDHLARILVKMNLLSRTALPRVAALMKEGKTSDRAILEASNLGGAEIEQGAREQAIQILASLFGWESAELHCYRADVAANRQIDLGFSLPDFLVLSARRAVAHRTIPSGLKVLSGKLASDPTLAPDLMALPLDSGEALAYAQIQQPTALESLPASTFIAGVRTEEIIQRLLLLGFLRLQDSPAEAESGDSPARAARDIAEHLDDLLRRFEVSNFYEILSVAPEAADSDIKAAYHELAKQIHPDRFQSREFGAEIRSRAEKAFTYVTGAYRTLGDAAKRAGYDAERLRKDSRLEAALQARSAIDIEREKMAEALYRSGRIALVRRQFEKAAEQLKECVWLRPDVSRYQHFLGAAQAEIPKMRKEAEQHLLKAIALDRMQPDVYLVLGKLYMKVNLPRRAELQFQEVLCWDPDNPEAQRLLQEIAGAGGNQKGGLRRNKTPLPRS